MKKRLLKLLGLYTQADMVSFGNYLLSMEREKVLMENCNSPFEYEAKSVKVHDADFDQWKSR
jgi:hypothetical protein